MVQVVLHSGRTVAFLDSGWLSSWSLQVSALPMEDWNLVCFQQALLVLRTFLFLEENP